MSEDPRLVAAIREAVIRENLRWEGRDASGPLPTTGAANVYVTDVERYVVVGIAALRAHEHEATTPPYEGLSALEIPTATRIALRGMAKVFIRQWRWAELDEEGAIAELFEMLAVAYREGAK